MQVIPSDKNDVLNMKDMEIINNMLKIERDRYYNLYREKIFFRL